MDSARPAKDLGSRDQTRFSGPSLPRLAFRGPINAEKPGDDGRPPISPGPRSLADEIGIAHLRSPTLLLELANQVQRAIVDVSPSLGIGVANPNDTPVVFVDTLERRGGELTLRTLPDPLGD